MAPGRGRAGSIGLPDIIEGVPVRVFWKDRASRYLGCNTLFAKDLGVDGPADLIGRSDDDLCPPEDAARYHADDREVMAKGTGKAIFEQRRSAPGGEARWRRTSKMPLRDTTGAVVGVVGICEDVTEQMVARERLRLTEDRYRALVEQSPLATQIVAPDGRTIGVNDAWTKLWGVPLEALADYNVLEDPQLEARGILPLLRRAFAGESVELPEIEYDRSATPGVRGTLGRVWVHTRAFAVLYPDGTVREVVLLHEDRTARKYAEESLLQTRERHEEAQRLAHLGHWELDLQTNELEWSDEVYRIFGVAPGSFGASYEAFLARVHPDDRERIGEAYLRSVRDRTPYDVEHRVVTEDGEVKWVNERGETSYAPDGTPLRSVGTVQDVTGRHEIEASVERANAFLEGIIARAAEGISVCFATGEFPFVRFTVWNARMTEITGYTMAEINHLGWHQTMYPDLEQRQRAIDRMERMRQGEDLVDEEWEVTTRSGEKRTLSISTSLLIRDDGPPAVIGLMHDVTSRIRAVEALHQSEQKYRGIFDESVTAIFVFDQERRFVDANHAGLELLGYARDELLRLRITDLEIDPVAAGSAHQDLPTGGRLVTYQHRLRRADGRIVTVLGNSQPLTDSDGAVVGLLSTMIDVTELQEAQAERARLHAQLQEARRLEAIGRLAGGVAHDFNNMLSVILGCTDMALGRLAPDDPIGSDLREIRDAAKRSVDLTRQLLAFASRQSAEPVVLDLNAKVSGMLKMLRRVIGENISLSWEPGEDVWPVRTDPSQIDQILANLCVNARDAIAGTGTVRIATSNVTLSEAHAGRHPGARAGEHALLKFSDDGCGMEPAVLEHVFEPFFTTKQVGEGTGLGLATVYGVVRQLGGHIAVTSRSGEGTTFAIYLPAARQPAAAASARPQPGHRGSAEIVLLVEDEPGVRRVTSRLLERLGYSPLGASSAHAALELAEQHGGAIDLLLTDVIMPDMNGPELSRQLRARHPELRTLFMSGYPSDFLPEDGPEGSTQLLAKPFTESELARKLRQVLGS